MATRPPLAAALIAGVQQLPDWVLTTRSSAQEPSAVWCRSMTRKTFPRAPCQATQTRPLESVVATGLTSVPGFSEILMGSESLPLSRDRAQISKLARSCLGQFLFSDQNTQATPLASTVTAH